MGMVHKGGNAVPFHGDHHPVKVATHRKSRNLFNTNYFNSTDYGVTFSTDDDGIITLNGQATKGVTAYYNKDFPPGTYSISVRFLTPRGDESNKPLGVRVRNAENKQYVQFIDTGIDYASSQIENEVYQKLKIGIVLIKGVSYDNYKLQIQFEEGSEATRFEPYGLIEEPIFKPIDQAQDGKTLTFENTYNDTADVTVFGESTQDGEPTPDNPVPIVSIKSVELVSSNADGSKSATRTIDLQGHELRSLPDGTHDELVVYKDGTVELVQRCFYTQKSVASMNNSDEYPGWLNVEGLHEAMGELNNTVLCINTAGIYANVRGANIVIGVNTLNNYDILWVLPRGIGGMNQTEFKEAYPDLVIDFIVKARNPKTIQLPSIDPLPTYHPYTVVDGNGAGISACVKVFE